MASYLLLLGATPCPRALLSPLARTNKCASLSNRSLIYPPFSLLNGQKDNLFLPLRFQFERRRKNSFTCSYNGKEKLEPVSSEKSSKEEWPIFQRWDVPWGWQTSSLVMIACAISFFLTGLVEQSLLPYFGFQGAEATLDEKAVVLLFGQLSVTAVVLGVIYGITNTFRPFSDDIFLYDVREPLKLQNGWLLWAGIWLIGALIAIALVGVGTNLINGEPPQRETDALSRLLPLIGSSSTSTTSLVVITGVLAPLLEETIFRGFLMVSLTKWVPTPVAVAISAATFALAHFTPSEFPQLFVLGAALGLSYAQTRNLLTPITIHACWNSGVILLLTFLQLQGYDIKELLQAT
ncbi:CAAX amino terminal protease family protein [Carex rostrata]